MTVTSQTPDLLADFTAAARRYPDRVAVLSDGTPLTYAQLAQRVAARASELGPAPGAVEVPAVRAPETVIGLLGAVTAGGAYCPVDPAFPAERRTAMRKALAAGVPDGIAYVLFTSGSTGEPKPVLTPRTAIGTVVASLRELFALTPDDRVLQFASLNWDTCFEEILPTLTAGAALVFDAEAHTGSFPRFLRMVEQRGITVLDLPTAFWHELVRHLAEEGRGLPACLRLVVIGGEAANPARVAEWLALAPQVRLLNTYGCTETTLITHAVYVDSDTATATAGVPPIGRALPHVRELITEDGELLVGGPALAAGYLGRPEATDERFVLRDGARWFRTGDRVRREPGGLLFHEGRLDHVVKIRGVRVDPGEVEAQLTRHPAVDAAAVVGTALAGRTALVAYVVARDENDDLLGWLRARVPAHLVPSRLIYVPELERTASGKADRAATHRRYAPAGRAAQAGKAVNR
ncbi:amino acid adenylation domain-containing protein [Catenulispora subtropica]|uniref:AMP-dependent synthetase and ligase n=1 Tax=Catenulispora subtropica TaxID=450798 RepID=A0ABP5CBA0_9ACTN